MKKLIINGDDFGFSEAYNYGIVHAFEHGVMTSASIMPNMDAAVHAAALAKMHPRLCISQHTNIVQGRPCADPATIPSIVKKDGSFYRSTEYKPEGPLSSVMSDKCKGEVVADKEDFKRETRAQLERLKSLIGYYPVHIEGHSIGTSSIKAGLLEVAREYGMHTMAFDDTPQEGFAKVGYCFKELAEMSAFMGADYNKNGYTVESFIRMLEILHKTDNEIIAVHCHPGYVDATIMDNSTLVLPRCRDLQTLCDPRVAQWIAQHGIELIRYDEIRAA